MGSSNPCTAAIIHIKRRLEKENTLLAECLRVFIACHPGAVRGILGSAAMGGLLFHFFFLSASRGNKSAGDVVS